MRLESDTRDSYIELELVEVVSDSVRAMNSVKSKGFSGQNDNVWFGMSELNEFVHSLKKIDERLKGSVCIKSIDMGEFILNLQSMDSLGHFLLSFELSKRTYIRGIAQTHRISGGFEVDHTFMKKVEKMFLEQLRSFGK
ncbi:hypothetical protein [Oceanobacillus senegalensis]|uniref:hypothetical protein n=1 Tax=Oceanobacillus senegalensis TaxID=1936063 RepID=UPI000A304515|nr:hypothetical protein [Oceanobacillus senegalensis]